MTRKGVQELSWLGMYVFGGQDMFSEPLPLCVDAVFVERSICLRLSD